MGRKKNILTPPPKPQGEPPRRPGVGNDGRPGVHYSIRVDPEVQTALRKSGSTAVRKALSDFLRSHEILPVTPEATASDTTDHEEDAL